ncbi:MAG TPA: ribosome maturation factor RimM [Polyangiaceae bacterium]|jgi:16S rRNA processing protein RimM|nr:ribosome maturation factor RimM [Polyangiaceae bacterium]
MSTASDSRATANDAGDALEIGRVSKAHGILGELKIVPHWSASDALLHAQKLWLTRNGQRSVYAVEQARAVPRAYLVKLGGINDRNAAEALHGATVHVPRALLPPLEPGEYYLVDLIGVRVVGPNGDVGEVISVESHPTVDAVVIKLQNGDTAEQALSAPWLASVDVAERRIVLHSLDGLM